MLLDFQPKAMLFDMDGVLYNSMPNHAVAWTRSMAEFGIIMSEHDAYATEGARGIDTIRMMVKEQQGRDIDEVESQRMYDLKTRYFHEMAEAQVFPGVLTLMQKLKDADITIGVVTGSGQRPLIHRLLTDFAGFLDESHIVTAYDVKHGKPNPDPYLMGMEKCGVKAHETVVVENAPLGVRAAKAANIFTIAVNTGPLPDAELAAEGADVILPSMEALSMAWDAKER